VRALLAALVVASAALRCLSSDAVIAADDAASVILVAHDSRIEAFDGRLKRLWSIDGLPHPGSIVVSSDGGMAAVIDPLSDRAILFAVSSGQSTALATGPTPVAGIFIGRDLYLLERDAAQVERIGADGARNRIDLAPDPAFVRRSDRFLYVYSRTGGKLQEIDSSSDRIVRLVDAGIAASDLEIDGAYAYLVYPKRGKIELIDLHTMRPAGGIDVGTVPTDMALTSAGTPITAARFAVADPAAKTAWQIEGVESTTRAVARGFLRGLIGLGLHSAHHDEYPTGIDRLAAVGTTLLAYDSSSRTLYALVKKRPAMIATGLGPASFAITGAGVVTWENGGLHRIAR
jgi:hypothetical protein